MRRPPSSFAFLGQVRRQVLEGSIGSKWGRGSCAALRAMLVLGLAGALVPLLSFVDSRGQDEEARRTLSCHDRRQIVLLLAVDHSAIDGAEQLPLNHTGPGVRGANAAGVVGANSP